MRMRKRVLDYLPYAEITVGDFSTAMFEVETPDSIEESPGFPISQSHVQALGCASLSSERAADSLSDICTRCSPKPCMLMTPSRSNSSLSESIYDDGLRGVLDDLEKKMLCRIQSDLARCSPSTKTISLASEDRRSLSSPDLRRQQCRIDENPSLFLSATDDFRISRTSMVPAQPVLANDLWCDHTPSVCDPGDVETFQRFNRPEHKAAFPSPQEVNLKEHINTNDSCKVALPSLVTYEPFPSDKTSFTQPAVWFHEHNSKLSHLEISSECDNAKGSSSNFDAVVSNDDLSPSSSTCRHRIAKNTLRNPDLSSPKQRTAHRATKISKASVVNASMSSVLTDSHNQPADLVNALPVRRRKFSTDNCGKKKERKWVKRKISDSDVKSKHNLSERDRRSDMFDRFQNLRRQIPELRDYPKCAKVAILKAAIQHIRCLKDLSIALETKVKEQMDENGRLMHALSTYQTCDYMKC